jgi:uncharacterized membrane protein
MVVIAYPDEETADKARNKIVELQRQRLLTLQDAVVAVRRADGKVKVDQAADLTGPSALSGAFWGMLIGWIFLVPLLGAALGAAAGALSGRMANIGVDRVFIKEVGDSMPMGSSALFLLMRDVQPDRVIDEMNDFGGKIIKTNLSKADEELLREEFVA